MFDVHQGGPAIIQTRRLLFCFCSRLDNYRGSEVDIKRITSYYNKTSFLLNTVKATGALYLLGRRGLSSIWNSLRRHALTCYIGRKKMNEYAQQCKERLDPLNILMELKCTKSSSFSGQIICNSKVNQMSVFISINRNLIFSPQGYLHS